MAKPSPTSRAKTCKQCGSTSRPAPWPGPRCATCHREFRRQVKAKNHARRVQGTYGITGEEYLKIKEFQGGKCAICQRATGATKALAVDHCHATNLVRGILCSPCNVLIGRAHDDVTFFVRAIEYLLNPPAPRALGGPRYAPSEEAAGRSSDEEPK
jgi:hypothetical protein